MKWRVTLLFTLRWSKVLSNEWFRLPVCYLSEVMPDLIEETDTSDRLPLSLLKGLDALWLRFLLHPHPNHPAQINPMSPAHKENGHGRVWFISHRATIRAQLASRLPYKPYTSCPLFFSPPPTVTPSHRLSHTLNLSLGRGQRHKDGSKSKGAD